MPPVAKRRLTLLDMTLLVGSAAIGMGVFTLARRSVFKGWIPLVDRGIPDVHTWTTWDVVASGTDISSFLLPLVGPWTFLLILLRLRNPRPSRRRIFSQPGMAACIAALVGWLWSGLGLLLAVDLDRVARSRRVITLDEWVQKYLSDEVFMYCGLAVASVWFIQYFGGRWRRSADWIDRMGRAIGVLWIVIGIAWTLHEYLDVV
jgi:hypothetical protein